jgi:hypothetical protein
MLGVNPKDKQVQVKSDLKHFWRAIINLFFWSWGLK